MIHILCIYTQMVRDASNSSTYQPSGPKTHEFKIGEKPNFDISYNHYKTSVNLGRLMFTAQLQIFLDYIILVPSAGCTQHHIYRYKSK